jgi:hypothetical protein
MMRLSHWTRAVSAAIVQTLFYKFADDAHGG